MAQLLTGLAVLLLCILERHITMCKTQNCYQAVAECNVDKRCSVKLTQYAEQCQQIVDTYNIQQTNVSKYPCSNSCVKAIKSLRQTVKGNALWKCDCLLDAHCLVLKARTEKCLAMDNGTYRKRTGCTLALYKCMRDKKCRVAQMDFLNKCEKVFTLTECTNHCLCSQKRLFSLPVGRALQDCECDGSDELYCLGLRAHANRLKCSWKRKRARRRCKRCNSKRCKRCSKQSQKKDKCNKRLSKKKD